MSDNISILGNRSILNQTKLAVFCSSCCPGSLILEAYDIFQGFRERRQPVMHEIDRVLAKRYGFTDPPARRLRRAGEEQDFVINHDIKYRMGRDTAEEDAVE